LFQIIANSLNLRAPDSPSLQKIRFNITTFNFTTLQQLKN